MLGRKVMLSSATIPPAMAEGYLHAYSQGWALFSQTRNAEKNIGCAWIDESDTQVKTLDTRLPGEQRINHYRSHHDTFISRRIRALDKQAATRRAELIDYSTLLKARRDGLADEALQTRYFNAIGQRAHALHQRHYMVEAASAIHISFGVIRVANIHLCVALTRYLLSMQWQADTAAKVMAYHSNQVLLMRHEQERHLDCVLKRKQEKNASQASAFGNAIIREHIDKAQQQGLKNLLFIVVATPVEEVGRDHDFDWAIIEPSSYRSMVQMAGRVQRHRKQAVCSPNIALMQYNWRALKDGAKAKGAYFIWPGFESQTTCIDPNSGRYALCEDYDLKKLVDFNWISKKLDAQARIGTAPQGFGLAQLEQLVTGTWLATTAAKGASTLLGYTSEHWYLTGLCQANHRFRASQQGITLFWYLTENQALIFAAKNAKGQVLQDDLGEVMPRDEATVKTSNNKQVVSYKIEALPLTAEEKNNCWLHRDYPTLLHHMADEKNMTINDAALLFGELTLPRYHQNDRKLLFYFTDELGFYRHQGGHNAR